MVVPYEDDPNGRHLTPVYRTVLIEGYGLIGGNEDQPATAVEIDRELAGAVELERVGASGHQVQNPTGGCQIREASP